MLATLEFAARPNRVKKGRPSHNPRRRRHSPLRNGACRLLERTDLARRAPRQCTQFVYGKKRACCSPEQRACAQSRGRGVRLDRMKSHSVWLSTLMHGMHNAFRDLFLSR